MAKKVANAEVEGIISVIQSGKKQDLIILFIPSHDNQDKPINNQEFWAEAAMDLFWELYGGATAFQTFAGIYRTEDGRKLRDKPILIESYTSREALEDKDCLKQLIGFMKRIGRETKQASVAVVINDVFHEVIDFS